MILHLYTECKKLHAFSTWFHYSGFTVPLGGEDAPVMKSPSNIVTVSFINVMVSLLLLSRVFYGRFGRGEGSINDYGVGYLEVKFATECLYTGIERVLISTRFSQ